MANTIDLIKQQITKIPELKNLASSDTPEFKKWKQVTLIIIEKKLGKERADNFPSDFEFWPNRIGPWGETELKETLLKGLETAEAYLLGLTEELEIFGEDDFNTPKQMPSSRDYPKLKFGESGGEGKTGAGGSIFIQTNSLNVKAGGKISADGGNYLISKEELNNFGTINQVLVEAVNNISKLTQLINQSSLEEKEKLQLIGDVETIKAQIIKPQPDKSILKKAWLVIETASTIGGAAELIKMIAPVVLAFLK